MLDKKRSWENNSIIVTLGSRLDDRTTMLLEAFVAHFPGFLTKICSRKKPQEIQE